MLAGGPLCFLQALSDGVDSHKQDFEKSVSSLEELSQHKQLLVPAPVDTCRTALDRRWKGLGKEVRSSLCGGGERMVL